MLAGGDQGGAGLFHRMAIAFDSTTSTLLVQDSEGLHTVTTDVPVTTMFGSASGGHLAVAGDGTIYVADQSSIFVIHRG